MANDNHGSAQAVAQTQDDIVEPPRTDRIESRGGLIEKWQLRVAIARANPNRFCIPPLEKGEITRGWLGVSIQGFTPEIAKFLGVTRTDGALVGDVFKDGPTDRAGIQPADEIIEFEGQQPKTRKGCRS